MTRSEMIDLAVRRTFKDPDAHHAMLRIYSWAAAGNDVRRYIWWPTAASVIRAEFRRIEEEQAAP